MLVRNPINYNKRDMMMMMIILLLRQRATI